MAINTSLWSNNCIFRQCRGIAQCHHNQKTFLHGEPESLSAGCAKVTPTNPTTPSVLSEKRPLGTLVLTHVRAASSQIHTGFIVNSTGRRGDHHAQTQRWPEYPAKQVRDSRLLQDPERCGEQWRRKRGCQADRTRSSDQSESTPYAISNDEGFPVIWAFATNTH